MIQTRTKGSKTRQGLIDLVNYLDDYEVMVEVGSYTGNSAQIFAQKFKDIFCIDPWIPNYDNGRMAKQDYIQVEALFDEATNGLPVTKLKGTSIDFIDQFEDKSLSFVYIDGNHSYEYVKSDIILWSPKVKKVIGGHDYKDKEPGVKRAINELLGGPDKVFKDSSWLKILD